MREETQEDHNPIIHLKRTTETSLVHFFIYRFLQDEVEDSKLHQDLLKKA